jgi:hypothetical protein
MAERRLKNYNDWGYSQLRELPAAPCSLADETLPAAHVRPHCPFQQWSIGGLVVEYVVAVDVTWVRFPARAPDKSPPSTPLGERKVGTAFGFRVAKC